MFTRTLSIVVLLVSLGGCKQPDEIESSNSSPVSTPVPQPPDAETKSEPSSETQSARTQAVSTPSVNSQSPSTESAKGMVRALEIDLGRFEPVIREQLSKAIEQAKASPQSAEVVGGLAMLLDSYNIRAEAIPLYLAASGLDPDSFRWAYLGGRLLLLQKQVDQSLELLTRAAALKPDYIPCQVTLINGLIRAGRLKDAGERAVTLREKYPRHPLANYLLGSINLKLEAPVYALQFLKPVHDQFPNLGRVREELAATFEMLGQAEKAATLREVEFANDRIPTIMDPEHEAVLRLATGTAIENERGAFALMQGDVKSANAHFARALQFSPNNVSARVGLATTLMRVGEFEQSEAIAKPLLAENQNSPTGVVFMGQLRIAQGQLDEAEKLIERAVELGGDPVRILKLRLKLAGGRNDLKTVVSLLEKLVKVEPKHAGRQYDLANAYVRSNRYDEAEQAYTRTIKLNSRHAGAMEGLAAIYSSRGEPGASKTWYRRAFRTGGSAPETLFWAGRDALDRKDFPQAQSILKQAFAVYPKNIGIGDMLSRMYSMCPDPKMRSWEEAMRIATALYGEDELTMPLRGLHTLAAAHAEADSFQEAARLMQVGSDRATAIDDQDNVNRFDRARRTYLEYSHLYDPPGRP